MGANLDRLHYFEELKRQRFLERLSRYPHFRLTSIEVKHIHRQVHRCIAQIALKESQSIRLERVGNTVLLILKQLTVNASNGTRLVYSYVQYRRRVASQPFGLQYESKPFVNSITGEVNYDAEADQLLLFARVFPRERRHTRRLPEARNKKPFGRRPPGNSSTIRAARGSVVDRVPSHPRVLSVLRSSRGKTIRDTCGGIYLC
jgi:hypothetical protein